MRRGFSVAELLVSVTCMMLLSGALFAIFEMCSTTYRAGMTRQSLQSQLTIFSTRFSFDARQTSIYTAKRIPRTVTVTLDPTMSAQTVNVRRDLLSLGALRDAQAGTSYEAGTGLAKWDCYWIYAATQESPTGQLVRYRRDQVPTTLQKALGDFSTPGSYDLVPCTLAVPGTSQVLGRGLFKFETTVDLANQQLIVKLAFRGEQGHTEAGRRSLAEIAETMYRVKPENSWPRM